MELMGWSIFWVVFLQLHAILESRPWSRVTSSCAVFTSTTHALPYSKNRIFCPRHSRHFSTDNILLSMYYQSTNTSHVAWAQVLLAHSLPALKNWQIKEMGNYDCTQHALAYIKPLCVGGVEWQQCLQLHQLHSTCWFFSWEFFVCDVELSNLFHNNNSVIST